MLYYLLATDSCRGDIVSAIITAAKDIRRAKDQNDWTDGSQYADCHQTPFQTYPRPACIINTKSQTRIITG